METSKTKSFVFYKAIIYFFWFLVFFLFVYSFNFVIPAMIGAKKIPVRFDFEKVDLKISKNPGEDLLSLAYFNSDSLTSLTDGDIIIHSKAGKSYKAYYSPTFQKLRIKVPDGFSRNLIVMMGIFYILNSIVAIAILYIIGKVLSSLENGSPFIMRNANYIGIVSAITFGFIIVVYILSWIVESYIESIFYLSFQMRLTPAMLNALLFALVTGILAYVLKQGVKMKEEQDLTI